MINAAILSTITGITGLLVGLMVGYYKSRAEFTDRLAKMVSRSDCSDCDLRAVVADMDRDLDNGSEAFKQIRADIGAIQVDIGAIKALMQERAKVGGR